jgi:1-acyl-sn-glycerol-3-phosphate acyltransferase
LPPCLKVGNTRQSRGPSNQILHARHTIKQPRLLMFRFYDFIRLAVVTPPLLVSSQMKLVGAENLPTGGGFILASTHTSWFDPLWLARAVAPRRIHFMAKEELFINPFFGWYLKRILAFPVSRGRLTPSLVKHVERLLAAGEIVGVFPTGTRRAEENTVKHGLALFSVLAAVPVVPVTRRVVPIEGRLNIRCWCQTITFGKPIYPPSINSTKAIKPLIQKLSYIVEESLSELPGS